MAASTKQKRLSKIAREFNLGIHTIVEYLGKKGFETDTNPNTKIPSECYDLLLKEFGDQITVKEKSIEVSQQIRERRQERVGVKDSEEEISEDIPVKEVSVKDNSEIKKPKVKKVEAVVKEKKQADSKEVKPSEKPEKIDPVVPVSEEKSVKKPVEKPVEKAVDNIVEKIVEKTQEKKEVIADEPVPEKAKVMEEKKTVEAKKEPVAAPKEPVKAEAKPKPEKGKAKDEHLKSKPKTEEVKSTKDKAITDAKVDVKDEKIKVLRTINLEDLNQKTRPKKKSKEEKHLEKEIKEQERLATLKISEDRNKQKSKGDKTSKGTKKQQDKNHKKQVHKKPVPEKKVEKPEVVAVKPEKKESEFLETKVRKLDGPKVIGKINIEEYLQKEKNREKKRIQEKEALKAERKKLKDKKKRKRIKKDNAPVNKKSPTAGSTGAGANSAHRNKRPKKRKPRTVEVLEVDVQKQIKDTLARLENKKQKSKSAKYRRDKRDAGSKKRQEELKQVEAEKNILKINEFVSVSELAIMMEKQVAEVITVCMNIGINVSINQRLDAETMNIVADEFGFQIEFVSAESTEEFEEIIDSEEDLEPRAPIVTIMGHVDHGKTKLLDYIRHANVVAGEAGGITQHVGAYNVKLENGRKISFIDTPGHEAFTAMRARGAQVTDIVIIVIAADDDVMPQTIEAINHASAAGVPIVFAINKIDKPTSNPEKIKDKLAQMNYLVEDWGGKYQSQDISAKAGTNVDDLLEKVLLESDMLELKANPNRMAEGTIIESTLDKGRGYVATVLVQNGTLKQGDMMLAGTHYGRVKAMFNERQKRVKTAIPSTPVVILGLNGAPQSGDKFRIMDNESELKSIATRRQQLQREQSIRTQKHITLDEIGRRLALGNFQELNVVVKGDVDGSIEALSDSLIKLSTEELKVNVIHKAVGQITETDVMLATASNAVIIGFQVRPSVGVRKIAEKEEIEIRLYSIIYDAINDMKDAMEGMLSPEIRETITGTIEVIDVFKITNVGKVAGCKVTDGKIYRKSKIRLIRDGIVIYSGDLGSLKRYKDDVKEVFTGQECGLNIENYKDIKIGDVVEAFEETEIKRKLER